ncbi:hypothetical protein L7F22_002833 [Adiantum nelumboides]|nr:hypothetical protein [Adiantum nelumboides]
MESNIAGGNPSAPSALEQKASCSRSWVQYRHEDGLDPYRWTAKEGHHFLEDRPWQEVLKFYSLVAAGKLSLSDLTFYGSSHDRNIKFSSLASFKYDHLTPRAKQKNTTQKANDSPSMPSPPKSDSTSVKLPPRLLTSTESKISDAQLLKRGSPCKVVDVGGAKLRAGLVGLRALLGSCAGAIWAHRHITSRKDLFCSLDAAPAGKKVTCANNASYPIKGVGKILITISNGSDLCLPDVLYVPGIKKNLLSVSSLAKNGLRVIFEDDRCIVRDRENGYSLITTGTLENGLFVLDHYEKQIQACIAETKTQAMQDAELWHARFGHVGYGSLMTLQRHNMVHDLSLLEMPPRHVCEGCVLGKMHRFAFSQDGFVRATRKLQLVHSDVCGPMRTPSVGNSLYFVTFIDDFSRFCWVYPLKAKSYVFANFQHYVSMVENETGCKVQTLRTDRGGEYMSGAFKDFSGKKGIKNQCTMPYTPQQNGVAERKNRSLMEMARCMLKAKSLPHKLWMEAVACAAHVLNRCPTCALKTITPYESWYDRKPSVSYLRVFGYLAYAHIPQ